MVERGEERKKKRHRGPYKKGGHNRTYKKSKGGKN